MPDRGAKARRQRQNGDASDERGLAVHDQSGCAKRFIQAGQEFISGFITDDLV
jgi:hypothetical protein